MTTKRAQIALLIEAAKRMPPATGSGLTTREITDGLEYIATSPAPEYGGFHPNTVRIAQGALEVILRLRVALEEIARLPTGQLASPEQCAAVVTAMDVLSHPNVEMRHDRANDGTVPSVPHITETPSRERSLWPLVGRLENLKMTTDDKINSVLRNAVDAVKARNNGELPADDLCLYLACEILARDNTLAEAGPLIIIPRPSVGP